MCSAGFMMSVCVLWRPSGSCLLDWGFLGFIRYVQASHGLTLPFGVGRSSDSPIIRKIGNHIPLKSLWRTVHFVPYRFSSAHFTVQLNAHTDLLKGQTHFNNSWTLSTSGNRCGFQVLQLGGSLVACFVSLTDFNIDTWLSFSLFQDRWLKGINQFLISAENVRVWSTAEGIWTWAVGVGLGWVRLG